MNTGFHPNDITSRADARSLDGRQLVHQFEKRQRTEVDRYEWELFAAICVAKVLELERRLGAEDRRVRSELYGRSGNVVPMAGRKAMLRPTIRGDGGGAA